MATIVVGVDGSPSSVRALNWAADEAALRGAGLLLVHACAGPAPYPVRSASGLELTMLVAKQLREEGEQVLDAAVRVVRARSSEVPVHRLLLEGSAATALLERARRADLLVVGSRGRGGFAGLLLGSVSQQCIQHAACPVVVVREPR